MASFEPQDFGLDDPPPRPTTPTLRRGFVVVFLLLSLVTLVVYGVPYAAEQAGYAWESGRSRAAVEALDRLDKAGVVDRASGLFRMAAVAASPAVVNIQSERFRHEGVGAPGLPLGAGGNRLGRGLESFGVGSGVIIDRRNGFIVTNNHVIQGADRMTVRLSRGAETPARLVGADPKTDLAVLQIKGPVAVAAEWGDSDKLAIGDWVLAIGSPYMLDHTVTAGIISATGRNNLSLPGMDEGAYQDFLQTDAAINPGNSGGPLIDLAGKIIGINTAILTGNSFRGGGEEGGGASGGFEGIGLAIPSALARRVVEGLIKNGKVVRGYLGVIIQPVDPALAREFKLPDARGALVSQVQPGGPADRAGFQAGDVVVKLDGKEVPDSSSLRNRTAEITPGTEVAVELFRGGARQTIRVVVGELPTNSIPAISPYGFRVRELPPGAGGEPLPTVIIDAVVPGSLAHRAGLRPGLRVEAVGRTEVHTRAEFDRASAAYTPEQGLPMRVKLADDRSVAVTVGGPR